MEPGKKLVDFWPVSGARLDVQAVYNPQTQGITLRIRNLDSGFAVELAGHVEAGQAGVSDPALGACA